MGVKVVTKSGGGHRTLMAGHKADAQRLGASHALRASWRARRHIQTRLFGTCGVVIHRDERQKGNKAGKMHAAYKKQRSKKGITGKGSMGGC
jgi:hypothetical protein